MSIINKFFNCVRKRTRDDSKPMPHSYQVEVLVCHPRLGNSLTIVPVIVDAHTTGHARRQLLKDLKIKLGKTYRVN